MTKTVYARVVAESGDTVTVRLEEPMQLEPNARVRLTMETCGDPAVQPAFFLDVVQGLNLDGPADASTRLDDYLYGDASRGRSPLP